MNRNQLAIACRRCAVSLVAALTVGAILTNAGIGAEAPKPGQLLVNINTASAEELQFLPGIGASRALQIVDLRKTRGRFKKVDELGDVRGIGPVMLEKLRGRVTLTGKTQLPTASAGDRSK
jgi:comEA protein